MFIFFINFKKQYIIRCYSLNVCVCVCVCVCVLYRIHTQTNAQVDNAPQ